MTGRGWPTVVRGDDPHAVSLDVLVEGWLEAGLITADQADRMVAAVGRVPTTGHRLAPLAVEALAYVGGAVVLAGCGLLSASFWADLPDVARFAVVGVAALLLLLAGAAVPRRLAAAGRRVRSVLWLASTVAWAGAAAVLLDDVLASEGLDSATTAVLVAAATLTYAAGLWAALRYGLQQAATLAAAAALAAALAVRLDLPGEPGLGVWIVGASWFGLGWLRVITPCETPIALGAAAAVVGAMTTAASDLGMALTLTTVVAVIAAAVIRRDLVLLGLGTVAALLNAPAAIGRWFAGSAAAALVLVIVGCGLVAIAIWMARRAWPRAGGPDRARSTTVAP
ncbi:DUF2157 domain-containing protein [Nocardioides soli]|uniref:DUF2157 domain-containing protein n=1 Tax=Nocardioides soli TaxID=1036020 RepID=A0A7W4Z3J4_9ACTN|nr:DUF2157 domain-containing protein [Nocardioides soli]MBB3043775.1 hypothetical protein [Nocardioides soli]